MKQGYLLLLIVSLIAGGLTACGSTSDEGVATDTTRLISGEIVTSVSDVAALTRSYDGAVEGCVGDVCQVVAIKSDGEEMLGEVLGESFTWRVRLSEGTWMLGFYDSEENHLGYLSMNGSNAFALSAGEDLDLGQVYFQNGQGVLLEDMANMAQNGFAFAHGQDTDLDGILDDFDDDAPGYDPSIFSVIRSAPYANEEMVAPCRPIKIHLSQPIDETSLTSTTVVVTDELENILEGTLTYEENTEDTEYEVEFDPSDGFDLDTLITVTLQADDDGLKNMLGETFQETYAWSFRVRDFEHGTTLCEGLEDATSGQNGTGEEGDVENGAGTADDEENETEQHQNGR